MRDFVEQLAEALAGDPGEIQLHKARVLTQGRIRLQPDEEEFRLAEHGTNIATIYGAAWWLDQHYKAISQLQMRGDHPDALRDLQRTRDALLANYTHMQQRLADDWRGRQAPDVQRVWHRDNTGRTYEIVTATNCADTAPAT